jgi:hypothetical protein
MLCPLEPDHDQEMGKLEFGHVTPPFRMKLSPGFGELDPQTAEHPCIPGKCIHGDVFEVPLLESLPPA